MQILLGMMTANTWKCESVYFKEKEMCDATIGKDKADLVKYSDSSRLWLPWLGRCVGRLDEETVVKRKSQGFTMNKSLSE